MSQKGQLATASPPKLNGRYRIGQQTVVDAPSSDGLAPIPAIRRTRINPLKPTNNGRSPSAGDNVY
jgi:hypothetical protein